MAITPYATETEVNQILSEFGVTVRVDDDDNGSADSGMIDAALEKATADVNLYLLQRYPISSLLNNAWVTWCTATLAICNIARRRGNPIPDSLEAECKEYRERLLDIKEGRLELPADSGLALPSADNTPAVANYTVDGRYPRTHVRRIPATSTGGNQTDGRKQHNANDNFYPQ